MMETYKKQIDDSTIGPRETSYLNGMTKNKVVNQMSNDDEDDEDVVCDERRRNFINSTNCHADIKTVSSSTKSSPVRVGYRKTPLVHHKSCNKRSRTLVKIAKLLAKRNSSSNDDDSDNDRESKNVKLSMILQRQKHSDHIESPSIMRSLIHHKTHQTKHITLNEMAKRLTKMLKRSWNESTNGKSAQTLVTKSLRRRSLCEECSTMNEIVTTRFETNFINFCKVTKCENSAKNISVRLEKPTDNETANVSWNLLKGRESESVRCSAFSLYSKDCEKNHGVLIDNGTEKSSTEQFFAPNGKPHLNSVLNERNDNSSIVDDFATSTKLQLPVLILDTSALNSFISFIPFPNYYFHTLSNPIVIDDGDKNVSDENNFYVFNCDENSLSSSTVGDDMIDVDKEVEQLTKSKKRKKNRRFIRFVEPVAWTLTNGNDMVRIMTPNKNLFLNVE